jgi:hypothetical protein
MHAAAQASTAALIPRARGSGSPITDSALADERIDAHDAAESTDPADAAEPTEKAEAADPTDPIEANDPTEPIDSTESLEAIDRYEPSDHSERSPATYARTIRVPLRSTLRAPGRLRRVR